MGSNFNQIISMPAIDIIRWMQSVFDELQVSQQRQLVVLRGPIDWCDGHCEQLGQHFPILLISNRHAQATAFDQAESCLGSESGLVVVDLFDGFNPDVVCIAAGLVQRGGVLLLLSELSGCWDSSRDRYAQWQHETVSARPAYIEYFFDAIEQDPKVGVIITPESRPPQLAQLPTLQATKIAKGETEEQSEALLHVESWISAKKSGVVLISADRGRGKSTCLGILLQRLQSAGSKELLVTAASRRHAGRLLEQAAGVDFIAPDRLLQELPAATAVVIDEAAMIPQSLLKRICQRYPLVIMATTTGGYEGTGQGFMLRFVNELSQAGLLHLKLDKPVRWCEGDVMESWINQTLMPKTDSGAAVELSQDCELECLEPGSGSEQQALLGQVYALLSTAHYRTRPSDLRMIMENPDLRILIARSNGVITGAALLNIEGGFSEALGREIFLGRRRPRGHLLAQMLTAQAGVEHFAGFRGLRILRIAVIESCRRQGVGRQLIRAAFDYARQNKLDYLGASFALDPDNLSFWQQTGFSLAHVSFASGKSTGDHSIAVLKPVSNELQPSLELLQQRIKQQLPVWLTQFLSNLDTTQVMALIRYSACRHQLSPLELGEVEAFARGNKGFELCFASLQKFVMQHIATSNSELPALLVEKAVQNLDWKRLAREAGSEGRRQLQQRLRRLVDGLIKA